MVRPVVGLAPMAAPSLPACSMVPNHSASAPRKARRRRRLGQRRGRLGSSPGWPAPSRAAASDAEVVTLAVMQALLGFTSEARWLRFATDHLRHLFPCLPHPVS